MFIRSAKGAREKLQEKERQRESREVTGRCGERKKGHRKE
jgi:hypothetical protein